MKNKIHLELRKTELEWARTLPYCPEADYLEMGQELREIKETLGITNDGKGKKEEDYEGDPEWCPYCDCEYHDERDCPACAGLYD